VFLLLIYSSVDISPAGITLRGSLAVGAFPPAHVEYAPVPRPSSAGPDPLVPRGPDFSALKAWIPGGVIERFEWSTPGQAQPFIDEHRFVLLAPDPVFDPGAAATAALRAFADAAPAAAALHGFRPLCLTVRGSRVTAAGAVTRRAVSGTICGFGTFPVLEIAASARAAAMVTLTQAGPNGLAEVVGHMPAPSDAGRAGVPNRVVHFADDQSASRLDVLSQGVRESGRADAATAVVAVLTSRQLAGVRHAADVVFADGDGDAWERALGLERVARPTTLLVGPRGEIAWRHEGPVDAETLAAALRKNLTAGRAVPRTLNALNLRLGRQAPNFLFELAPGHALTLRKLAGRAVVLVFWRSTSKASIDAVREHQTRHAAHQAPVVLAVNDGEPVDLARRAAKEHGLSATLVPDPERTISTAYGVTLWPTTVLLDTQSVATEIAYGRGGGHGDHGGATYPTGAAVAS
jgi:peroxiredoxin